MIPCSLLGLVHEVGVCDAPWASACFDGVGSEPPRPKYVGTEVGRDRSARCFLQEVVVGDPFVPSDARRQPL